MFIEKVIEAQSSRAATSCSLIGEAATRAAAASGVSVRTRKPARALEYSSAAVRVEAILRDVTERQKLQDQARDVYHQLSQAEKLASLGQTMSGVAHELNNPLATILACTERLAGRRLDDA